MPSADSRLSSEDTPPPNPPTNPSGGSGRNFHADSVLPVAKSKRRIVADNAPPPLNLAPPMLNLSDSTTVRTLPSVENTPADALAPSCLLTWPVSASSRQSLPSLFRMRDFASGVNAMKSPEAGPTDVRYL